MDPKRKGRELVDRLPPHALEAEQGVLGCALLAPTEAMPILVARCPGPEVFYDHRHQEIYRQLSIMHDGRELIDMITVRQRLIIANLLDAVGGLPYLASLPDAVPSAANLEYYFEIVLEKYQLRQVIKQCTAVITRAYDHDADAPLIIESLQRDSLRFTSRRNDLGVKAAVRGAIDDIEEDFKSGGQLTGIPTGFGDFDRMTRGLQAGEFIVIAARPSVGKSALVMNIAEHNVLEHRTPVGVFSLEMTKKALIRRMISANARINLHHLAGGGLSDEEFPRLAAAARRIEASPLYIEDRRGQTDAQICAGLRFMVLEYGIKIGIVDYLQLVQARRRREKRAYEIADICHNLKDLAGELEIPIVVCAQLSRDVDKGSKSRRPRASDLRESGDIEQDADVIGLLHKVQDDSRQQKDTIPTELDIAKQRNGPTGVVDLLFMRAITRFRSTPKISDEDVASLPGMGI